MKQTRKQKRNRKRKLKKGFKFLLAAIPTVALLVVIVIYGFQLKSVDINSDLNQFTQEEVKAYMETEEIDNTLIFWLQNKIGRSRKMDLFEQYSVTMKSPMKVSIKAYEKKLKGYILAEKIYYYFDDSGKILKCSSEKIKGVPKITGLKCDELKLYQVINAEDKKALKTLLNVTDAIEEYNFPVKRIDLTKEYETTLFIKKVQVQLGKESNLDKKLRDFNDNYKNVIHFSGVLNMKRVNEEGVYTLKRTDR